MRLSLLLTCLVLGGCAWSPGEGFAVVEPTVSAVYAPRADRAAEGGYQRLSSDYQVRLEAASLRLEGIELLARSGGGGGGGGFDPANPPPGYSLCHGGHCHRDDGALIPYEQIEAELGGGGGARAVVTLPVDAPWNLLAAETRAVTCEPACELPRTEVSRGRWPVVALRMEGTARDSRPTPRFPGERRFLLEVASSPGDELPVAVLEGDVELPSDRNHPPRVELALKLELTAALFDAVDWGALSEGPDGVVDFGAEANTAARAALLARLARVSPEAEVTREQR
jgi:hypothetical protein